MTGKYLSLNFKSMLIEEEETVSYTSSGCGCCSHTTKIGFTEAIKRIDIQMSDLKKMKNRLKEIRRESRIKKKA